MAFKSNIRTMFYAIFFDLKNGIVLTPVKRGLKTIDKNLRLVFYKLKRDPLVLKKDALLHYYGPKFFEISIGQFTGFFKISF